MALDAFLSWGWEDIGQVLRRPSDPASLHPSDSEARRALRALVLPLGPHTIADPQALAHENRTQRPD
nr:hypothetical protein [Streptomyces sp. MMG1533]